MRARPEAPGWRTLGGPEQADPVPVQAQARDAEILLPSGQRVVLQDVVWNAPGPEGLTSRFRFIAPAIAAAGGTVDFEAASADMLWLCQNYALPRIASPGPMPAQIVISLSDQALPFGQSDPDATQFFEAYTIEDGLCVWSDF